MNPTPFLAQDDLHAELGALAAWAEARPQARELQALWAEVPGDLRAEWAAGMRLGPPPAPPRMKGAGRASAAALMAASSLPWTAQAAQAAPISVPYMIAAAPVVRVVNAATGAGVSGVAVKSMDEKVFGHTDGEGQITLPAEAMGNEGVIALEKDGYAVQIVDVTQLSGRNVVSLRPSGPARMASAGGTGGEAHGEPEVPPPVPPAPQAPAARPTAAPRALPTPPRPPAPRAIAHAVAPGSHAAAPVAHATQAPRAEAPRPVVHLPAQPQLASRPVTAPTARPAATPDPALAAARAAALALPSRPRLASAAQASAAPTPVPTEAPTMAPPAAPTLPAPQALATASRPGHGAHAYHQVVRPGDSLSALAKRHLGSARRWPELFAANRDRISDPSVIRVGQVLRIPAAHGRWAGRTLATRWYVVKPGDTLATIAQAQYGRVGRWPTIWRLNARYVQNPGRIFAGQRLRLPLR